MKKITKIVLSFIFILLCTGCVKYNANMTIKKDKKMDFSIIYAVNSSLMNDEKIINDNELKNLKKQGYKIEEYNKDDMKGFIISKTYKNIDEISSDKNNKYSLSGILDNYKKDVKVFKVKKGLFKNHYYANFEFDSNDSSLNNNMSDDELDTDFGYEEPQIEESDDIFNNEEISEEDDSSSLDDFNFDSLSNMDLSFNVKLPYKAIKNNSSSTKNNDKQLKWNLQTDNKEAIKFEFELYNYKNIYLTILIGSISLIGLITIVTVLLIKKKKH